MPNNTPDAWRSLDGRCVFPECESPQADNLRLPICKGHVLKTYRIADKLVRDVLPRHATTARPLQGLRQGHVYFLSFAGLIKIGFSQDVAMRLASVPHDELLATMPGTMRDEKELLERFAHLRHKGEWFKPGPDLMAHIASLKGAA